MLRYVSSPLRQKPKSGSKFFQSAYIKIIMNKYFPSSPPKSHNSLCLVPHPLKPPNSLASQLFLTHNPTKAYALPRSLHQLMSLGSSMGTDWQFSAPASIVTHLNPWEFISLGLFDEWAICTTFANALWLETLRYKDNDLIRHYRHAGMLLRGLPVETLESYDWKNHCVALLTEVCERRFDADRRATWRRIYRRIWRTEWISYIWKYGSRQLSVWHWGWNITWKCHW